MFRFKHEQSIVNIGGTRFGGQPGEMPTVLCGTIFYHGHKVVQDEETGIFNREKAESLITRQAELANETGNPAVLHIYARTSKAFERYLEFSETIWSGPMIIDSADSVTRGAMAEIVSELGYADKIIFNSISLATAEAESQAIMDSEIDSAILLAYNPANSSIDGALDILETGSSVREKGLIPQAREMGIVNMLIDPGVMPLGNRAGSALRFSIVAKSKLGLPVGSGIHNAISAWPWLSGKEKTIRKCCDSAASAMQLLSAGDFLLYGPIENADFIFPVIAMADILVAEAVQDLEIWPVSGHPLHKLV